MDPDIKPNEPIVATSPEAPVQQLTTQPIQPPKKNNGARIHVFYSLVILLIIGCGLGAYFWRDAEANRQKKADASNIEALTDRIEELVPAKSDTLRKNDLSHVMASITIYQSNNRGALPADQSMWDAFMENYVKFGVEFSDPAGTPYKLSLTGALPATFDADNPLILVNTGAICNGNGISKDQGSRKVALQMRLQSGAVYCLNN